MFLDVVSVASTVSFLDDVSNLGKVGHDRVCGSLGDIDRCCNVAKPRFGVACNEEQGTSVIGEEAP